MTKCEYIRNYVSMRELLEKYGFQFSRRGFMHCCFHNEKTPSACVSKDDRWYRCYGCGTSLNTIDFVAKYEKCSRKTAIAKIDEMFQLGLGNNLTDEQKTELETAIIKNKLKKREQEQYKREKQLALDKIVAELKLWQQIQTYTHPTRGQVRKGTWEFEDLFFFAVKQQEWLNWLYDTICEYDHEDCIYDHTVTDSKREIIKKVLSNDILLLRS